jgi:hypothetical protein
MPVQTSCMPRKMAYGTRWKEATATRERIASPNCWTNLKQAGDRSVLGLLSRCLLSVQRAPRLLLTGVLECCPVRKQSNDDGVKSGRATVVG